MSNEEESEVMERRLPIVFIVKEYTLCEFDCNLKRKRAGRRTKSINIAAKSPRKSRPENLQVLVWKKSAN
jgi:hypothetical protein